MRNVLYKICRKNKKHFMFLNLFFFQSCRLWQNVEKFGARRASNDVTITYGAYALHNGNARLHGARIRRQACNTYCFSTATMIWERASILRYTFIASLAVCQRKHIFWVFQGNIMSLISITEHFCCQQF